MYKAMGNKIVQVDHNGEQFDVAFCNVPYEAIKLLDKARYMNDVKRKYTASARLFFQVEQLTGFTWIIPVK